MEQKLKSILDYQRFSPNRRLSAIIEDVEKRYYALDDDELSLIAAAGDTLAETGFLKKRQTQARTYDKEQVYTEYYPKVLRYIENRSSVRMDAEDLAQTVFMKVFRKWDVFDPEKSSLSTWIFNITRNTLIDHQRAMAFRQHGELSETLVDDSDGILEHLIMEDELERLADALETLSTEERDLIILHYYNGETLLCIAELMRRPYGQIKRLHVKALKKLRKQMGMESMRLYTGSMQVKYIK